ncbi:MAG: hypothetical protein VKI83_11505 [Synechococcaceae cyanobacterium]|nr:hypothetical protein [Synechococcaceae cyanobacterium]
MRQRHALPPGGDDVVVLVPVGAMPRLAAADAAMDAVQRSSSQPVQVSSSAGARPRANEAPS